MGRSVLPRIAGCQGAASGTIPGSYPGSCSFLAFLLRHPTFWHRDPIVAAMAQLPEQLRRSLTWDHGSKMPKARCLKHAQLRTDGQHRGVLLRPAQCRESRR